MNKDQITQLELQFGLYLILRPSRFDPTLKSDYVECDWVTRKIRLPKGRPFFKLIPNKPPQTKPSTANDKAHI